MNTHPAWALGRWWISSLVSLVLLSSAGLADAQTAPIITAPLTTVSSFPSGESGIDPFIPAVVQGGDGNFYGTTNSGGTGNEGTVFKVTPSGTLTTLCSFAGTNGSSPSAGLIEGNDGNFYGTTSTGGSSSDGTVFKVSPSGTLTSLFSFSGANGATPSTSLIQGSDGNFYGTTEGGGTGNEGTVFKVTPSGTLTNLCSFTGTNGAAPEGALIQGNDGNFYGTASGGGSSGDGTVFKVTPSGTLTTLCSFSGTNGEYPAAGLTAGSDGNFYGTTSQGGSSGDGTVFKITPSGTLTTLCSFTGANGEYPAAELIEGSDGNFYGTTSQGGSGGEGTVFEVTPSGTLTTLYTFTGANGGYPTAGLTEGSDGNFYGTTSQGGSSSGGTVFKLTPPIASAGTGSAFSYQITATNNPTTYGASGLPSGLGLNTSTGLISGTPRAAGTYVVTLSATNGGGTASAALTLTVNLTALTWTGSVSSTWDTTTLNWLNGGTSAAYGDGDSVTLDDNGRGGTISLSGAFSPFSVTANNSAKSYTLAGSGSLNGSMVLNKSGSGTLTLSGTNAYTGGTTINGGVVSVASDGTSNGNLGAVPGSVTPASITLNGGALQITGITRNNNSSSTPDTISTKRGITLGSSGGTITVSTPATGSFDTGESATQYAGVIAGSGNLTVTGGTGTNSGSNAYLLELGGLSTYAGTTTVNNAVVSFQNTSSAITNILPSTTVLNLVNNGWFVLNNYTSKQTIAGLSGDSTGRVAATNSGAASVLTIDPASGQNYTFAGVIGAQTLLNKLGNDSTLSLVFNGTGTETLSGASTYTGTTSLNAGTLLVNGSLASPLSVASGAALGGSGTIQNNVTMASGSGLRFNVTSGGVAGLVINGNLVLNGTVNATPTMVSGSLANGTYVIARYTGTLSGSPSFVWTAPPGGTQSAIFDTSTPGVIKLEINTPAITSSTTASGTIGTAFSYTITGSNSPTSYGESGTLPAGLSFNSSTGVISGTPTTAGTSSVTISASNGGGTGSATLTITINPPAPVITSASTATGTEGVAFSYTITGSNSPASYNATGLPSGLSVNTSTGLISGTPTAAGTSSVIISATNAGGTGTATLALTINSPAPVITSATTANGTVGAVFSYSITGSNIPTSYGESGTLPAGLSFNSGTGVISGTPTAVGTSSVTISAGNAGGTGTATLTITINPPAPVITSGTTAGGTVGAAFSYAISGSNSPTSYGESGTLPAGLSFNSSTGVISGTPTAAGTVSVTISAGNAGGTGTATLTITINPPAPVITSGTTASGTVGAAFSYTITGSNSPMSYGESGTLPSGLSFDSGTGVISGTPTAAGTVAVTISASNVTGTGTATLTITVNPPAPVITSATTASGTVGAAFSYAITASNSPASYGESGTLPAGLSFNAGTGVISGTPSAAGSSSVTVSATNSGGTGTATLVITINSPAPVITSAGTASGTEGTAFSYQITATNNPTSFGITGSLPAGVSLNTTSGLISGTPTVAGTYTVTISATNIAGTGTEVLTINLQSLAAAVSPTFSPAAGTYGTSQIVTMTSTTPGSTIYYTLDGTTPTTGSASVASGGTVVIAQSETLQAIAVASGLPASAATSGSYTIGNPGAPAEPFTVSIAATGPFQTPANPVIVTNITHPSSVSITSVTFYQNINGTGTVTQTVLGTVTQAPYQYVYSSLAPGYYSISATATASNGTTATATTQFDVTSANDYVRGFSSDPVFDSSVHAVDSELGVRLDSASYSSLFPTQYPWFLRTEVQSNQPWQHIVSIDDSGTPSHSAFNTIPTSGGTVVGGAPPLVAFGSQGGGSALYTNQSYHFGVAAGGQLVFAPIGITSMNSSTGVLTTSKSHGLQAGQMIILSGVATGGTLDSSLNGTLFLVGSVPAANTLTLTTLSGTTVSLPSNYTGSSGYVDTAAISISSINNSTGVITTAINHGLKAGQMIVISGGTVSGGGADTALNGTYYVGSSPGANTLTLTSTPGGSTVALSGTYTANSALITNPDIKVEVYRVTDFASGANEVSPIYTQAFTVPNPCNTPAWNAFVANGNVQDFHLVHADGANTIDFDTQVQLEAAPGVSTGQTTTSVSAATTTWGQQVDYALMVTHRAANTLYYYKVSYMGVTTTSNGGASSTGVDVPSSVQDVPMAVDSTGTNQVYNLDYSLDFSTPSSTQSVLTTQPQFQETPMPASAQGMSVEELIENAPQVQDILDAPAASGSQAGTLTYGGHTLDLIHVDTSTELREHQVLDKFVASMNNDPMALANYVLNEVKLSDAIGFNPTTGQVAAPSSDSTISSVSAGVITTTAAHHLYPGEMVSISGVTGDMASTLNSTFLVATTPSPTTLTLVSNATAGGAPVVPTGVYGGTGLINSVNTSINPQGVRRDALATFLEGQGSPAEQCALLVYMLRKANVPCGYVFPNQDQMLMIDQQISSMLRMQIQGENGSASPQSIPELIPVNYPWVAAYINVNGTQQWVHIFPWLKNTVLQEGPDVWSFLPSGYRTGAQWLRHYVMNDASIRQLTTPGGLYTDDINTLFPLYVQQQLEGTSLSLDQLGMKVYNQQEYYTRWQDFPRPWQTPVITDANLAQNLDYTQNPSALTPALQNIFDTINVQVISDRGNDGGTDSGDPAINTGTLNLADLHDRRFLLYHTVASAASATYNMTLSLEPFGDPNDTSTTAYTFKAGSNPDQSNLMNHQSATVTLTSADDALVYKVAYSLHQQAQAIPDYTDVNNWSFFLGTLEALTLNDTRSLRKGDMAALCLDYGTVTQQMEDFQAEKYWQYQQTAATGTADPEEWEGQLLYVMGDSYYYRVSQLEQNVENWTKSNVVSFLGHGLSKLSPLRDSSGNLELINQDLSLCYPRVDMVFDETAYVGNGTPDLESGDTGNTVSDSANQLFIGGGSALEHITLNQFFKQDTAVSTVKLLDILQGWTPGAASMVVGSGTYTSGGTIASPSLSISAATYDGVNPAVVTTSAAHGLSVGQRITISGVAGDSGLNGTFVVASIPSSTSFTLRANTNAGVATMPGTGPVMLTAANYQAMGATKYTVDSATLTLQAWCGPSLWSNITAPFSDPNKGPLSVAYVTPGPVTATAQAVPAGTGAQQYTGMGALCLGVGNYEAYISGNIQISEGGVINDGGYNQYLGYSFAPTSQLVDSVPNLTLTLDSSGYDVTLPGSNSLSLLSDTLAPSSPADTYSNNDLGTIDLGLTSGSLVYNSQQITSLDYGENLLTLNGTLANSALGESSPTGSLADLSNSGALTADATNQLANSGNLGENNYFGALETGSSGVSGIAQAVYDPVDTITGEFYVNALDLKLNGPMPLEIRRIYGSLNQAQNNFGYGWRMNYFPYLMLSSDAVYNSANTALTTLPTVIYAAEMDGSVIAYRYQASPTPHWSPQASDNPTLSNVAGGAVGGTSNPFNNCINPVNSGTGGATSGFTLTGADGSVRAFTINNYPSSGTTAVTRARPYLQKWTDSRGNYYTFTYGSDSTAADYGQVNFIQSSNGDSVAFTYNVDGDITEAYTGDGRFLYYQYDSYGDLTQVTLPDASTIQYTYQHVMTPAVAGTPVNSSVLNQTYLANSGTITNDNNIAILSVNNSTGTFTTASVNGLAVNNTVVISGAATTASGHPAYAAMNGTFTVSSVSGNSFTLTSGAAPAAAESTHLITQETKPNGRVLENSYDSQRRVVTQSATVGSNETLVRNAAFNYGTPTKDTDGITYDGQTVITDVFSNTTTYKYVANQITEVDYPAQNEAQSSQHSNGAKTTQTWYTTTGSGGYARSLKSSTDQRGLVTSYTYDGNGNLLTLKRQGNLVGTGGSDTTTTTMTYDTGTVTLPGGGSMAANALAGMSDQLGNGVSYEYGNSAYPLEPTTVNKLAGGSTISTAALQYGNSTGSSASAYGLVTQETYASGTPDQAVVQYSYDAHGFLTSKTQQTNTNDPDVVTQYTFDERGEETSETDGAGQSTRFSYDALGHRTAVQRYDASGNLVSWNFTSYNQNGEVEWEQGPRYSPSDYVYKHYDGAGRLSQETLSLSAALVSGSGVNSAGTAVTNYQHDNYGNVTEVIDPNQNATVMSYDAIGNMTGRTIHTGSSTTVSTESFTYDPKGAVLTHVDRLGGTETRTYTSGGLLESDAMPDGSSKSYQYDLTGRVVKETLPNGSYWQTTYDDVDRTMTRTLYSGGSALMNDVKVVDRRGNVISETDVDGNTFLTSYDGLNRVKTVQGPPGGAAPGSTTARQILVHVYDAAGIMHTVTNGNGERTVSFADAQGRPTLVTVYNADGSTASTKSYSYSADHQSVTTTEGTGGANSSAPAIVTTTFTDTRGHPVLVQHGDGSTEYYAYDANGNKTTYIDGQGNTTSWGYDGLNRVTSTTVPGNTTTQYSYTDSGSGETVVRSMPGGISYKTVCDSAGRETEEETDGGGSTVMGQYSYTYYSSNAAGGVIGKLKTVQDPRGFSTTTNYDAWARPASVTSTGGNAYQNQNTTYGYDNRGLMTSVTQGYGSGSTGASTRVTRSYDAYGQMNSESTYVDSSGGTSNFNSGTLISQWAQSWDAAGRRTALNWQVTNEAGSQYAYSYYGNGNLASVTNDFQTYHYSYGDDGLLTGRSTPWLTQSITSRDGVGRILDENSTSGGGTLLSETMAYRGDGRLSSYQDSGPAISASETRNYQYDARGRVTVEPYLLTSSSALQSSMVGQQYAQYQFDGNTANGIGVRTLQGVSPTLQTTGTATYPYGYQVVSQNGLGQSAQDVAVPLNVALSGNSGAPPLDLYTGSLSGTAVNFNSPPADSAGNCTGRTVPSYLSQTTTWDSFNRLAQVSSVNGASFASGDGSTWTTVYDGLGRRVQTVWQPTSGGSATGTATTITYYYDPEVQYLELGHNYGGRTWNVYGPDRSGSYGGAQGIGGLEAVVMPGNGSGWGIVNNSFGDGVGISYGGGASGSWNAALGGYGEMPGSWVNLSLQPEWRGHYEDPTGFYYMGARYYDPSSGRFLSADPLGHDGSMDLYSYCGGDPVNGIDPDGCQGVNGNVEGDSTGGNSLADIGNQMALDQLHEQMYDDQPVTAEEVVNGLINVAGTIVEMPFQMLERGVTDGIGAVTGYDAITGEELSVSQRLEMGGNALLTFSPFFEIEGAEVGINVFRGAEESVAGAEDVSAGVDSLTSSEDVISGADDFASSGGGGAGGATWQDFTGQAQAIIDAVKAQYNNVEAYGMATDGAVDESSNFVYRVIRSDEDPAAGLFAKNPDATYTPEGHVLNGSRPGWASQFISTTADSSVAQSWAAKTGNQIVMIDLSKINGTVIDLSTQAGRNLYLKGITAKNFSAASSEVLIQGEVPASAITPFKP